ncbi:glycosyltransferase family 2 protein [Akkermansia sp. N21169]|uniref:glycosyltransferase family 2 protein n=1 Tax=Akkermansia sp. N21169 TaxID=3040765 RepID=UPI00244EC325|nr:glycosyltransferase family 2 protein [Akkermansia sp. N21169]MDH3069559.1 glycosyltransferase family 2 protein [Akkermansia sp. N21169]
MMKISVVIPCYNVELHIRKCLDSILAQTYTDFEVICVDDRSTDSSLSILQKYKKKDDRIRIFQLPINSGSAKYPRDYAVQQSYAPWICAVDADDYIPKDYLEKLIIRQDVTHAQVILSKMLFFNDSNPKLLTIPADEFDFDQILSGREAVMLTINGWKIGAAGALVSKKIWVNQYKFLNQKFTHMNADEFATREILVNSSRVAFSDAVYYYRKHEDSITANSCRVFEMLITDRALIQLFKEKFGKASREYKIAITHYISSIASLTKYYNSIEKPTELTYNTLRSHYNLLSINHIIASTASWRRKLVMLLPFYFYRILMK